MCIYEYIYMEWAGACCGEVRLDDDDDDDEDGNDDEVQHLQRKIRIRNGRWGCVWALECGMDG